MSGEVIRHNSVVRIKQLRQRTGISVSSIYNKLNPRSKYYDQTFPKPIRLGASSVGWLAADVDAWLASRPQVAQAYTN